MKNHNKKMICVIMAFAMLCLLFAGCASDGPQKNDGQEDESQTAQAAEDGESWSVFWYLCGTDLESDGSAATANIEEAMQADLPENVNFIIQTGGTKQWATDAISAENLQRFRMDGSDLTLVDEQPLMSMGEAQTLGNFLQWGVEQYPADKYMVLFWNHGGGSVAGVEFDELFENDSLTLSELSEGLAMAETEFELIGFDTCLMATLETAAAVAPYGKYLVASEEYEPGGGWDYTAWLSHIANDPGTDGLALGKAICDSYYEKCALSGDEAMATLSVTDLGQISVLSEAFDGMAAELAGASGDIDSLRNIVQGAGRTESYGGNTDEEGYTNMVDLNHLAANLSEVIPAQTQAVSDALGAAVLYNVNGEQRAEASGLSVFYPLETTSEELDQYAQVATSEAYLGFIGSLSDWNAPESVPETDERVNAEDYEVQFETSLDGEGMFRLNITSGLEAVDSVLFRLYYMDEEYNEYMLMGLDNDIETNWEEGTFADNFRGVWPTINGNYCAPELIEEGDGYNLYSIPVVLNGVNTNLRASYVLDDGENGHFEIFGAWNGIDSETGMSARDVTKLQDGDQIEFVFKATNWDTGEETSYTLGGFTVDGQVVMEESPLFDGDYLYQYEVKDIFGNTTYSDTVIMECKNGEITAYETQPAA